MQLMILLSALLASLTGLMAGARPVEPAQMELSAPRIAIQAPAALTTQAERPANIAPWHDMRAVVNRPVGWLFVLLLGLSVFALPAVKQSWLE